MNVTKKAVKYKNKTVQCYGDISLEKNISVYCTLEVEDQIVGNSFDSWKEATEVLASSGYFSSGIKRLEVT